MLEPSLVPIGPDIAVAAEDSRPFDLCIFEAGFRATAVRRGRSGSNAAYSWNVPTTYTWQAAGASATGATMAGCAQRFAPPKVHTVVELREIYDRWVLERECLISLGFTPHRPPSFAEFQYTWYSGPWTPIDGVPFGELGGDPKKRCGLEMLD